MANMGKATMNGSHALMGADITGGFLDGAKLEFSTGLNCIIGGRGTGKTTILEFVRYTLGLMPDQKRGSKSRAHSVVQNNLSNGRIRLNLNTLHGMQYTADRPWNDECQVLDENGEATTISLDRDQIFKADVYSQNEIEQIATDTGFQLKLIDQFEEENISQINGEIGKLIRDIEHSSGEIQQIDRQMQNLTETASEASAIEEKLKGFQQQTTGPNAEAVNDAHTHKALRDREKLAMTALQKEIGTFADRFQKGMESLMQKLDGQINQDLLSGPNKTIFDSASARVSIITDEFRKAIPWVAERCKNAMIELEDLDQTLNKQHAQQEQVYRKIMEKSHEEKGRSTERTRLQKRHLAVGEAKRNLGELEKKHKKSATQHRKMTSQLSILRDKRFRLRKKVADHLTSSLTPTIRVTVAQSGNLSAFTDLLTVGLKGSGLRYASIVEKMVPNLSPTDLATIIQLRDFDRLVEMAGLDSERAIRIINLLAKDGFIGKLETVDLEDLPKIELLDGQDYKDANSLSTGQRCTTILPILLLESDRPLLIDQPEDNLDNAFIFETIVKSIKEAKAKRQLIFVTHNPNIPVLGEAERVFVFSSDGRQGTITHSGTVDEVKGEIETLLEGGREAFLQRKERYGH